MSPGLSKEKESQPMPCLTAMHPWQAPSPPLCQTSTSSSHTVRDKPHPLGCFCWLEALWLAELTTFPTCGGPPLACWLHSSLASCRQAPCNHEHAL